MKITKLFNIHSLSLVLILLFSLGPLLWFKDGNLITGTDVDFALFPQERLQERLYTWFPKILGGIDRSNNTSSIPYIATSAFYSNLGFDLVAVEQLTFITWFFFSGLGMYFLMTQVVLDSEKNKNFVFLSRIFAVFIYMYNFYNVFLWVRLQLAIAGLVLFPVMLALLIGYYSKRISKLLSLSVLSFVTLLCGPIGIQPPVLFVMFFSTTLYVLFVLIPHLLKREYAQAKSFIIYYALFLLVFFLSSAYWAFTLLSFIWNAGYSDSAVAAEVYSVESLLLWTSSITSFSNIFRMYGDVVWFDGWQGAPYMPEILPYLTNPILIFSSFILPATVFYALEIKIKRYIPHIAFFSFLTLVGLFFSKGVHAPFGGIFSWMIKNVPLFWIHRAPWQKFTFMTVVGYSVLGGISFAYLYTNLTKRIKSFKLSVHLYFLLVAGFILGFNYFFLFGNMFPSKDSNIGYHGIYNLGFHHKFPKYLFDARSYVNLQQDESQILLLPDSKTNVYEWGYAGATGIESLLFNKGTIATQYGEGFAPPSSIEGLINPLLRTIYLGNSPNASRALGLFNIKYLLQRNDFRYDFFGDTDSPEFIAKSLDVQEGINKVESFGAWDLYETASNDLYPLIYVPTTIIQYEGIPLGLVDFTRNNPELENIGYFSSIDDPDMHLYYLTPSTFIFPKLSDMTWHKYWAWPESDASPNTLLYKLVRIKENLQLQIKSDSLQRVDILSWLAAKRVSEAQAFYYLDKTTLAGLFSDSVEKRKEAFELLEAIPSSNRNSEYWQSVNKYLLYGQRAIKQLDASLVAGTQYTDLVSSFERDKEWYDLASNTECLVHCYEFNVTDFGTYSLRMSSDSPSADYPVFPVETEISDKTLIFNNSSMSIPIEINNSDEVMNIISYSELPNLVDSNWESSSWEELLPLIKTDEYLLEKLEDNKVSQNVELLKISSPKDLTTYNLKLSYSIPGGTLGLIIIENSNVGTHKIISSKTFDSVDCIAQSDTSENDCARTIIYPFSTTVNTKNLDVYVFSFSDDSSKLNFDIKTIEIRSELQLRFYLTQQNSTKEEPQSQSSSELVFTKINPTKYAIQIVTSSSEPFPIIFNQNYHPGWRLYNSEHKEIARASHNIANGWANSWIIKPSDLANSSDNTFYIEFYSQKVFIVGLYTALITLSVLILATAYVQKNK